MSWSEMLGVFLMVAGSMGLLALISFAAGRMAARDDEIDVEISEQE